MCKIHSEWEHPQPSCIFHLVLPFSPQLFYFYLGRSVSVSLEPPGPHTGMATKKDARGWEQTICNWEPKKSG